MNSFATIVYYTSNREDPGFENRITFRLLKTANKLNMPLISVSQKPMPGFGKNICVGDVGVSNQNVGRQLQIGAEEAKTPFVISAESDCLYPLEYFSFIPPFKDRCYRYDNVWILYKFKNVFKKKDYSECGQIVGRDFLIKCLKENYCVGRGQWNPVLEHGKNVPPSYFPNLWDYYRTHIPIVNIKTKEGMHSWTGTSGGIAPVPELPRWGSADQVNKEMFG